MCQLTGYYCHATFIERLENVTLMKVANHYRNNENMSNEYNKENSIEFELCEMRRTFFPFPNE